MFEIGNYFTVGEADESIIFGNEKYLRGGMEQYKDLPVEDCILASVRDLGKFRHRRYLPMMIFDVKAKKKKIYND